MANVLPFGSEFSPSQIVLGRLLELIHANEGDVKSLESNILNEFFSEHNTSLSNKKKLANNSKLGLIAYKIIERDGMFTDFGKNLFSLRSDETTMYDELARHILVNLNGMQLVQCVQDMVVAGEVVNLTSLRAGLAERGTNYPPGGKHPSIMRLWLEKAGVFVNGRWQVDDKKVQQLVGVSSEEFHSLSGLTVEQRFFLKALANTGIDDFQGSNDVVKLAETVYGVKFPEKSLPATVLNRLKELGYIEMTKTTTGRGAKPFLVKPTGKLKSDLIEPLLKQLDSHVDAKVISLLRLPLSEILLNISSKDRHISGLALEALAFKLMRILDMDYLATRLRGISTGGAEVDLIFQSTRLVFSRWQIQCKNTGLVSLDDVAKEVGLTHFLKSNTIVIVCNGRIGGEARRYANRIMMDSNLAIVMLDKLDLDKLVNNPAYIVDCFEREAIQAMKLKVLTL